MKRICVVIGSRANYSSIKSALAAIRDHNNLELQIVANASAVLEKYGNVANLIQEDGFYINHKFYMLLEGENPTSMAKSTGLGLLELPSILEQLDPHIVLTIGDRFETISTAIAATYMNKLLAHTMGGEVTGTIDESVRHAVTKFAHIHFPANEDSRQRIIRMGEKQDYIFNVGCPRVDLVKNELDNFDSQIVLEDLFIKYKGIGKMINFKNNYLLVSQHSVTTEYGSNRFQIEQTLEALRQLNLPTIMLWPNADAGSDEISKGVRTFREKFNPDWLCLFKNLPIKEYIHLLNTTSCLVGNSSSGIREGAFIGTPVVNLGTRQIKRMKGDNVIDANFQVNEIKQCIEKQIQHGKYNRSNIYGDGNSGTKIADILSEVNPEQQKNITY